ncbi:MAG: FadR/GntR family transcriptional regulator [Paracoccaceae bacterium]|uniref:FadR/GntR family transcriptional regulator n=1 Tax=Seohaeicola saemankumensis TaxID=481181 RepID=UPI001E617ED6|nr:FadR/GntR family transcriptional regulator [Seohaeicola saemankumensis]MCD1624631.1 FadR family transcriptional regulator [Seohaeicola saemankumensis]
MAQTGRFDDPLRHSTIRKRETLADQIYGRILELIASGQLAEGDKLPSEHQISEKFEVSRPVVREALARLRDDGIVSAQHGVGSFVRRRPPQGLIEHAGAGDVAGLMRCMEARLSLEAAAARHAALRASPRDLIRIEDALTFMEQTMRARKPVREADFDFHMAVAEASGNEIFCDMLNATRGLMMQAIGVAQTLTSTGSDARIESVLDEHRQILEAIRNRDAEGAALLMSYHLVQARLRVTDQERRT